MSIARLLPRAKGALGIASLWGGIWAVGGLASLLFLPGAPSLPLDLMLRMAARLGLSGFMLGGVFSVVLSSVYRDRSLIDIRTGRFTLLGAIVAAPFWPGAFLMAGAFGALSAWTSIKLAKSAEEQIPSPAEMEKLGDPGLSQTVT